MAMTIDDTILKLNQGIQQALEAHFPAADAESTRQVDFTFALPGPQYPPDISTVSIFLYDVQEDLQLRSGEGRRYDPVTGQLAPGLVHVRCCYLLTYWPASGKQASHDGPDSESMRAMNRILNALLNRRTFANLPGSYTRVIPPQEQLNSLGNFWQVMGNKPRLCLNYSVTVPLQLMSQVQDDIPPVTTPLATLKQAD